jgi:hypothetical protein
MDGTRGIAEPVLSLIEGILFPNPFDELAMIEIITGKMIRRISIKTIAVQKDSIIIMNAVL